MSYVSCKHLPRLKLWKQSRSFRNAPVGSSSSAFAELSTMDVDKWLARVKECKYLEEAQMRSLIDKAREIFLEEENVIAVQSPVSVCGDVHGQFFDVVTLFETGGDVPDNKYIFLGDYVDRGYYSLETFTWLLLLKVRYTKGHHMS